MRLFRGSAVVVGNAMRRDIIEDCSKGYKDKNTLIIGLHCNLSRSMLPSLLSRGWVLLASPGPGGEGGEAVAGSPFQRKCHLPRPRNLTSSLHGHTCVLIECR